MEAESLAQARKIKLQEEDIIDKERLLKLKVEEIINLKEKIKDI
ncbi:3700_t:CDS:2 [Rhizophagus irregularis]|nr:3700_t:CDS:2 [Rhizophagus irregularis]